MVIKAIHNAVCAGPVYPLTESTVRKFKSQKSVEMHYQKTHEKKVLKLEWFWLLFWGELIESTLKML